MPILLPKSNNIVCYNFSMAPEQIRPTDTSHNGPRIIRTKGLSAALSRWHALWCWLLAPAPETPGEAARAEEQVAQEGTPIHNDEEVDNSQ